MFAYIFLTCGLAVSGTGMYWYDVRCDSDYLVTVRTPPNLSLVRISSTILSATVRDVGAVDLTITASLHTRYASIGYGAECGIKRHVHETPKSHEMLAAAYTVLPATSELPTPPVPAPTESA